MKTGEFIFSKDGFEFLREFKEKFDCFFRYDEPSGDLVVDCGDCTYKIPEDEKVEEFMYAVTESIKTGNNLLEEKYKHSIITYDENLAY